ncbi:MAG: glycosyltransferase [Anaerolineaceae bacterium]|nr:glycosyltransferase [Anaerolineaceae bacterium]
MASNSKIQVVFVARKLWAGGAEKVLYYLAHRLDQKKFEPIVIYMLWQDNIPVKYDVSIPLYCLQKGDTNLNSPKNLDAANFISMPDGVEPHTNINILQNKPQKSTFLTLVRSLYRIYHSLPEPVKQRIALRTRLQKITHFERLGGVGEAMEQSEAEDSRAQSVNVVNEYANRFASSIGINIPDVVVMNRIMRTIRNDAILIPMQEEPTVRVWISQANSVYKYISYLCAPESLHMTLIYPDEKRFEIENWLFANAERCADAVVVPNDWMKSDMVDSFGVNPDRVNILANPVDCELIIEKMAQPLPHDFPDTQGRTLFVQLARVDDQKNHILMVEACKLLRKKYTDFLVLVIGNGNEFKKIRDLIMDYRLDENIRLLGESANPYPILKQARASLLTSKWEASPLVLVDSMLCGAVPISVDCIAGPRDMLGDNQFGLLVPPDNPKAFADAMYRIALDDELHGRLREQGLNEAWKYDIHKVVKEWEDLIIRVSENETKN